MIITKSKLTRIIKEELAHVMGEGSPFTGTEERIAFPAFVSIVKGHPDHPDEFSVVSLVANLKKAAETGAAALLDGIKKAPGPSKREMNFGKSPNEKNYDEVNKVAYALLDGLDADTNYLIKMLTSVLKDPSESVEKFNDAVGGKTGALGLLVKDLPILAKTLQLARSTIEDTGNPKALMFWLRGMGTDNKEKLNALFRQPLLSKTVEQLEKIAAALASIMDKYMKEKLGGDPRVNKDALNKSLGTDYEKDDGF